MSNTTVENNNKTKNKHRRNRSADTPKMADAVPKEVWSDALKMAKSQKTEGDSDKLRARVSELEKKIEELDSELSHVVEQAQLEINKVYEQIQIQQALLISQMEARIAASIDSYTKELFEVSKSELQKYTEDNTRYNKEVIDIEMNKAAAKLKRSTAVNVGVVGLGIAAGIGVANLAIPKKKD